jgi:tetratricopeptide (TPR) repeat protein
MTSRRAARRILLAVFLGTWAAGFGLGQAYAQSAPQGDQRLVRASQAMASGRFAEAIPLYVAVLADHPDDVEALTGAADALAASGRWQEAMPYLKRLVELRPYDAVRLTQYAQMLSWSSKTRAKAREALERALDFDPASVRARAALAELDSWSGSTGAALDGFAAVLAAEPASVTALRGMANIRAWNGDLLAARDLALQALKQEPTNPYTLLTLARVDADLGRGDEALDALKKIPSGTSYEGLEQIRGDALRGSSRWAESGFSWRDDRSGLTVYRPAVTVSSPVGGRGRASVWFNPTFFRGPQGNFSSSRLGVAFDARNDSWRMHAEADGEHYGSTGPIAADGAFDVAYRGRGPIAMAAGFRREAVEDTLVSAKGADIGGDFVGQVRSNLAYASISTTSIRSHIDATARVGGGAYTGHGLDANRRWSVGGSIGATLHGSRPYVRVGYAVDYLSFAFDASAQPLAPGQRRAGGYFSPTRFLTNVAVGRVAYRLEHDRGEVFAESSVGTQNVETTYGRFGDVGFAGTFAAGAIWRPGSMNEVRVEYRFLNVFNAFRRNTAAIAYRRYF